MDQAFVYSRHKTYKPTEVEWLGDIPANWSLESIRAVTQLKSEKNQPDLQVLSVYREYGVIPKDSRDDNHNATSLDTSGYKVVNEGDLVVNKMKAWQGSMGVSAHRGIVSPAYITCGVDAERVYPKFLHYLLRSRPYIGVYNALSYGVRVGQWDMHYEDFKRIPLPLPTVEEQQHIADSLDQKTAEIDEAIAKKQRLIELLKEQKAILINQAVTNGLNPDAPMRDSGVEWIGEVPEHWAIKKFKYCCRISSGQVDPRKEPYASMPLIAPNHIESSTGLLLEIESAAAQGADSGKYQLKAGDIIYSKIRPALKKACISPVDGLCSADMYVLKPSNMLDSRFLLNYILTDAFTLPALDAAMRVAMPKVNRDALGTFPLLLPPVKEQQEIADHIESVNGRADAVICSVRKQIEAISEYRTVLIANAVTGKIKL